VPGSATLNLRVSPRRILTLREAAEYIRVPVARFPAICSVRPVIINDKKLFDILDLDNWVDNLKGGVDDDDQILARLD
jgi:hypothetical protein